jgi:actin-like ATPase involved in cell morphogenesis
VGYCLGVDLGTTFVAAARSYRSRVEMVTLGDRAVVMPAAVYVAEDGNVLTGEAANRRGLATPRRVAHQFKRRLGDPTPLRLGDADYSASDLMAVVLREVLARVNRLEGEAPAEMVLTHPANWGPFRRGVFEEVPRLAGVPEVRMITEPEAAALHYAEARQLDDGALVAVYDLGGGTFDATVVRKLPDGVHTLGTPEGIERLGGIDFDQAVFDFVNFTCGGALTELDMRDPQTSIALNRLRQDCALAKESLSVDTETVLPVFLPGRQFDLRITRSQFEDLIRAQIESTITALSRALRSAGVTPDQLDAVLLVGGSSRIPLVAHMVSEELGRPILADTHPKYAVALGAATLANKPASPLATATRSPQPTPQPGGDRRQHPALTTRYRTGMAALLLAGIVAVAWTLIPYPGPPATPPLLNPNSDVPLPPPSPQPSPSTSVAPAIPIGDPRLVDHCALLNPIQFAGFGRVYAGPRIDGYFNQCRLYLRLNGGGKAEVAASFVENTARRVPSSAEERRGELGIVRLDAAQAGCPRNILLSDQTTVVISASVHEASTDACAIADAGTESAVRVLTERGVPHLSSLGEQNSLRRQNACAVLDDQTLHRVPALDSTRRDEAFGGWGCQWGSVPNVEGFQPSAVDLFFQWVNPLSASNGEQVRLAGRDVYIKPSVGMNNQEACFARVVHRNRSLGDGQRAQEIVVLAVYAGVPVNEKCQLARDLAASVISKLPPP